MGHENGDSLRNVNYFKTKVASTVDESSDLSVVESQVEDTALNETMHSSENSAQSNNTQHVDSKPVDEGAETTTDSGTKCLTSSGVDDEKIENSIAEEISLIADQDGGLEYGLRSEKKTDFSGTKTDASQIIADVVDSIEQESAPPVAPPRRKRKKKKSVGDTQVSITCS